mmetsp:Transcript_14861/g.56318  ORF Transcript_14861/g.56318 Transcript_14861/m.56318 type:complete len:367 (-) Transcript_14861:620-1720(-)
MRDAAHLRRPRAFPHLDDQERRPARSRAGRHLPAHQLLLGLLGDQGHAEVDGGPHQTGGGHQDLHQGDALPLASVGEPPSSASSDQRASQARSKPRSKRGRGGRPRGAGEAGAAQGPALSAAWGRHLAASAQRAQEPGPPGGPRQRDALHVHPRRVVGHHVPEHPPCHHAAVQERVHRRAALQLEESDHGGEEEAQRRAGLHRGRGRQHRAGLVAEAPLRSRRAGGGAAAERHEETLGCALQELQREDREDLRRPGLPREVRDALARPRLSRYASQGDGLHPADAELLDQCHRDALLRAGPHRCGARELRARLRDRPRQRVRPHLGVQQARRAAEDHPDDRRSESGPDPGLLDPERDHIHGDASEP